MFVTRVCTKRDVSKPKDLLGFPGPTFCPPFLPIQRCDSHTSLLVRVSRHSNGRPAGVKPQAANISRSNKLNNKVRQKTEPKWIWGEPELMDEARG